MNRELVSELSITNIKAPQSSGTSDVTSAEFDMSGFSGFILLTSLGTPANNNSMKVQSSDVSGSGMVDVSGANVVSAAGENNLGISLHRQRKRFHQAVISRGTGTTTGDIWLIRYGGRSAEIANTIAAAMKLTQVTDA